MALHYILKMPGLEEGFAKHRRFLLFQRVKRPSYGKGGALLHAGEDGFAVGRYYSSVLQNAPPSSL
jgi:hypothetical protein